VGWWEGQGNPTWDGEGRDLKKKKGNLKKGAVFRVEKVLEEKREPGGHVMWEKKGGMVEKSPRDRKGVLP